MQSVPLVLIGFNRPTVHERVLSNLSRCFDLHGSDGNRAAYAYLDAPRGPQDSAGVAAERDVMEKFKREYFPGLEIIARTKNFGCRQNIVQAITEVVNRHGRAIIVEDDILVSRTFLQYMDAALEFYDSNKRIWCINANTPATMSVPYSYKHDVYLHPRNMCWGWGVWKDRWDEVDFEMADWPRYRQDADFVTRMDALDRCIKLMLDAQYNGNLRTWDVQCTFHMFKHGLYAVEPRYALSKNIGTGADGVHCTKSVPVIEKQKYYDFLPRLDSVAPDVTVLRNLGRCGLDPRLSVRLIRRLRNECMRFAPCHDNPISL